MKDIERKNLFETIREEMNENKWDVEQSKCVNVFLIWNRRVLLAREVPRLGYERTNVKEQTCITIRATNKGPGGRTHMREGSFIYTMLKRQQFSRVGELLEQ